MEVKKEGQKSVLKGDRLQKMKDEAGENFGVRMKQK